MFVGIYRSMHTGEIEFDNGIHQGRRGSEGWEIVAVADMRADGEVGEFTAQQVLEGDAGAILVWHRAMA